MKKLIRFGVSFDQDLFEQFSHMNKEGKCTNRSKVIRELVRRELKTRGENHHDQIAGVITFIYDDEEGNLLDKILNTHHFDRKIIRSLQHVALGRQKCLAIAMVKGDCETVKRLADKISALRQVDCCRLTASGVDKG